MTVGDPSPWPVPMEYPRRTDTPVSPLEADRPAGAGLRPWRPGRDRAITDPPSRPAPQVTTGAGPVPTIPTGSVSGMSQEFTNRAERVVDALLEADPHTAAEAGDHRFDGRLVDHSTDAVTERVDMLRQAAHVLADVDVDTLDPAEAVDWEILQNRISTGLFDLTETREHTWNPLLHNPGPLLDALLSRPTMPVADRLDALADRLRAVPDALSTARATLSGVPRLFADTAAGQFRGTAALIRDRVPALLTGRPTASSTMEPLIEPAARACEELADRLAALPDGRDPRLGRRLWEAKLWLTLDTDRSATQLLDLAHRRLAEVGAELDEVAARFSGEPAGSNTTRRVLDRLAADRPNNSTVLAQAEKALAETVAFVTEHDLVTLPDDPLEVIEMPDWARGVAVAYCDPPGALETAPVPTVYAICPAPSWWDAAQVESYYREYNTHLLRNLTVHEAVPGHHLQLAHARRYRGSTRARAIATSGTFVEGWAVYAEELMTRHGFGGPAVRLQQLKMQLRSIINAIIDHGVHCDGMSREDAMELMTGRGFQSEAEATGKWNRALLSSTQLSTYFVGHTEIAALASADPTGRGGRAWHDAMLAHGSPPPRHLATMLGV